MNTQLAKLLNSDYCSGESFMTMYPPIKGNTGFWSDKFSGEFDDEGQAFWNNFPYTFELVGNYGGMDQGSSYWSVYKFTHKETSEETFIQFDGYYQSYYGSEYTDCFEVTPVEVTVTKFNRVQS